MKNKAIEIENLIDNPSVEELRRLAQHHEKTTTYQSASYVSQVRNRSAKHSFIIDDVELGIGQKGISRGEAEKIILQVKDYLSNQEVIRLDRRMGNNNEFSFNCRLYITKEYSRIAYMWNNTLFEALDKNNPDFTSIYVPEWPERIIIVDPINYETYILGTDYFGEAKKSFLRMAMYKVKNDKGLGLHAGSKVLRVKDKEGNLNEVGFIMFGLSGTGKTTLTIHNHGLEGEEAAIVRQDDVVFMDEKGACFGSENGFFIKTEGLDPSQKVLYDAAIHPATVFENVMVNEEGIIDFENTELTSNGRGVVLRQEIVNTDDSIDIEKANKIIFITRRNDIIPPVAKLTPEQAAMYFMLGESIETSAGDPTKAGQAKRCVGTNPFIIGPEAVEGQRIMEILKNNKDMECYLLNTGSVGAKEGFEGEKITITVSTEIMKQIAKDTIEWKKDEDWGYEVPLAMEGLDLCKYEPKQYYTEIEYKNIVNALRKERKQWLEQFDNIVIEGKAIIAS
ncbi:phosphoenolpyruvate carboxykinase (ATP) [Natronincola peptidivorans]|uniref:phosphoenolpyruvate carboxykinase (ATP) n=1 Tax=Natronincola peptidivorans TaxID=426128 RepID=UPI002E8E2F3B|nr:phosphoenolpyruvate carboxykinase (ATP) [Natronincola peptidivorans]